MKVFEGVLIALIVVAFGVWSYSVLSTDRAVRQSCSDSKCARGESYFDERQGCICIERPTP